MDASEEVFQLAEVKRRIAEVESGRVELVCGDEVLARARRLLAERCRRLAPDEFSPTFQRREPK